MPNCRAGISKPCGRACIPLIKNCRKDAAVPACNTCTTSVPKKPRKEPICTEGRSYKCGKACIAVTRPCRKTNTPAPKPATAGRGLDQWWSELPQAATTHVRNRYGDWVPEGDAALVASGLKPQVASGSNPQATSYFAPNVKDYRGSDAGTTCPFCKEVMPVGYWYHIQSGCRILNPNPVPNRWNKGNRMFRQTGNRVIRQTGPDTFVI